MATQRARNRKTDTYKKMNGGKWIRPERRLAIYLRDDFRCLYCLKDLRDATPTDLTLDHLKCRVDGGTNHESNLVTACRSCNSARGDLPLSRFAGKDTVAMVRRNTKRALRRYKTMAKALLADQTGNECENN